MDFTRAERYTIVSALLNKSRAHGVEADQLREVAGRKTTSPATRALYLDDADALDTLRDSTLDLVARFDAEIAAARRVES